MDEWEQCHLPLDDPNCVRPPGVTLCVGCGDLVHTSEGVTKTFYHNGSTAPQEYVYCTESCHYTHYIKCLNQLGM